MFTLFLLAATYARLGDWDIALDTLAECYRVRDAQLVFALTQPAYQGLRGHPRFERLLADLHLPPQGLVRAVSRAGPAAAHRWGR